MRGEHLWKATVLRGLWIISARSKVRILNATFRAKIVGVMHTKQKMFGVTKQHYFGGKELPFPTLLECF